jgi:hypothetical protein
MFASMRVVKPSAHARQYPPHLARCDLAILESLQQDPELMAVNHTCAGIPPSEHMITLVSKHPGGMSSTAHRCHPGLQIGSVQSSRRGAFLGPAPTTYRTKNIVKSPCIKRSLSASMPVCEQVVQRGQRSLAAWLACSCHSSRCKACPFCSSAGASAAACILPAACRPPWGLKQLRPSASNGGLLTQARLNAMSHCIMLRLRAGAVCEVRGGNGCRHGTMCADHGKLCRATIGTQFAGLEVANSANWSSFLR